MNADKWKTLPMELMSHFDDCKEWTIMERLWFKSNHNDKINLNYLNQTTPIKYRDTLLRALDGLVKKGWITKKPIGSSGKHHKYSLNKESFSAWVESQLTEQSENPTVLTEQEEVGQSDQKRSENPTSESRKIRPKLVGKSDCIDNEDNYLENIPDKRANPEVEKLLGRLKEKQFAVDTEEMEYQHFAKKFLFDKIKAEMIQAALANGSNYVPSDEVVNQKVAMHLSKWSKN